MAIQSRTCFIPRVKQFIRSLSWSQGWAETAEKARRRARLRTDTVVLRGIGTESLLDPDQYRPIANGGGWSLHPFGQSLFRYQGELFIGPDGDQLPVPFTEHFAGYLKMAAESHEPQVG